MDAQVYQIRTEYFEGPLDLLLHLIKKNKLNILEVKISEITAEYLYYLENSQAINPSREGDFLMTAATLIYIKSQHLLPRISGSDEESPEEKLVQSLIEFDKLQKICHMLKEMEQVETQQWRREEIPEVFGSKEYDIEEVSSFQLAEIFLNIIKRRDKESFLYIESKNYSIDRKKEEILALLAKEGFLNFNEYVEALDTIEDLLVSFFTMLELVKRRKLIAIQKRLFDTIYLWDIDKVQSVQ